uniref:pleckstrin homology domain-containing family S member 1-like isoform X2 n=1 Tax=Pristiophorus japonicus TaxID=55135 RepID=UPI00398E45F3
MKKGDRTSPVFYAGVSDTKDNGIRESDICYEGYFIKSPPFHLIGTQSSWKKRYFVLAKKNDEHNINYFKTKEESRKSSPLGDIPINNITELYVRPEYHPKWTTLQRMFKCISESVILLKTEERDYFFIGDKESVELFQGVIASLLQKKTEEQIQDSSGELAEDAVQLPSEMPSPIYATIPEILQVKNIKGESEEINPEPQVEPASSETSNIYDVPRKILERWSQPIPRLNKTEKPRASSLTTAELKVSSATYDTPRIVPRPKHRVEKALSTDSGIYMSMAAIDCSSTTSSIDCYPSSEQINEEEEIYCNVTNSGIIVADDIFLTKNQHCLLQSPYEHPLSEKSDLLFEKRKPLTYEHLKTLLSNVTDETKLEKLDVTVCRDDIKNNLSLLQVNEKACVAYSDGMCVFNHGDQIMAINKLQINDEKELVMLINRSMEEEVTVTILRLPEAPKFHSEDCNCDLEK